MDKELEQQAIATFVQQPEVYAEFLNNNGQDGSQIPVEEIKKDPDTYVQAFQKDKKFHDTVVGLFQAIVKSQQKSSMFREGGKFDYLKKFQAGGSIGDPTYRTVINAPGDTLRTKFYKYRTDEMQTYPNGNVRYTSRDNSQDRFSWSPDSKPNLMQRLLFGNRTASPEIIENWRQLMENHKNDTVIDKTKELQSGGSLTKREMFDKANSNRGFSKANTRLAYANAKAALRDQGYRGAAMREAARRMVVGTPRLARVTVPEDSNFVIPDQITEFELTEPDMSSINALIEQAPVLTKRPKVSNSTKVYSLPPEERITTSRPTSTNNNSGRLVVSVPPRVVSGPLNTRENSSNNIVGTPLPESERAAHDAFVASLNGETQTPVISRNNQRIIDNLQSGTSIYYGGTRPGEIIMSEPERYIRTPDGRWISPDQRYVTGISYDPVSVRKHGGRLKRK